MVAIEAGSHGLIEDEVVWRIAAGAESSLSFTLWRDADKTQPTDLSGFTGRCELRGRLGGSRLAVAAVTIDTNVVTVTLGATDSETWSVKQTAGVFDVELVSTTDPDMVVRLCSGSLDIAPNVTTGQA